MVDIFSRARINVHTFKHIYPLRLVHRPKGALLVYYFVKPHAKCAQVKCFEHMINNWNASRYQRLNFGKNGNLKLDHFIAVDHQTPAEIPREIVTDVYKAIVRGNCITLAENE